MPPLSPGLSWRLPPPVIPKEIATAPSGEDWIYEFLWGGERIRAVKGEVGVSLTTRDGRNLCNRFPAVAAAVARLRAPSAVIDGEILLLDRGTPEMVRFLKRLCDDQREATVLFIAYDLLQRGEEDLRRYPLLGRRLLLAAMVQGTPIVLSPLYQGDARAALSDAAILGVAGVVAKRAGSTYQPNAVARPWVKVTLPRASTRATRLDPPAATGHPPRAGGHI